MHASTLRLLAAAAAVVPIVSSLACDLEECDPTIDPTCTLVDSGADAGADTGGVADTGGGTDAGPAEPVYRYLYIFDLSAALSGSHPGADIDAVELIHDGRSVFGRAVSDRGFDPGLSNQADDSSQLLGAPATTGAAHRCDVDAEPAHWYSLGGGFVLVDFGAGNGVQDGDEIVIYECSGTSGGVTDTYGFGIGEFARVDAAGAQFTTVVDEASGTFRARVDFDGLGL